MTAKQLLDSRKFCLLMDDLATTWKKRGSTEEDKEYRLAQIIEFLGGDNAQAQLLQMQAAKLKAAQAGPSAEGAPADKAQLLEQMKAPLSAEETASLVAEAKANTPTEASIQDVVNRAVEEVIKPNWATSPNIEGCKHFYVKASRHGQQVSFDVEKWKAALKQHSLPDGNVTFKIEGLAMSDVGGGSKGTPTWRVMIG